MIRHKRILRKRRAWKAEMKSQWYWSLTRYSPLAHNGAQRCYKNHPSVCTSVAFDTLKRVEENFNCQSTFQGAMQRKCRRHRTQYPSSNGTSVRYTAQCYHGSSGKHKALTTSILFPKPSGNWVSEVIAALCLDLMRRGKCIPDFREIGKWFPRQNSTKVSPTQDGDAENRVIFIGVSAIFLWHNWVKPVPC